jgi:SPOR domain
VVANAPPVAKPPTPAAKPAPAKPAAVAAEAHPPASAHAPTVQLAALSSEQAARNEWQTLSRRMPELMNGRQPIYSRTEREGHTFWRVRTAGFADVAQARTFCEHVRGKGGGCSVADF